MTDTSKQSNGNQGHRGGGEHEQGHGGGGDHGRQELHVQVTYASAAKRYNDPHLDPASAVGALKTAVLQFFGLTEGSRPDGSVATYTLYYGKQALENLDQKIGAIDPGEKKLEMKLGEQITQGDDKSPVTAADIAFEDDLRETETVEDVKRWRLERGARQEVFVTLASAADPKNLYQMRLAWRSYPLDAPSLKFRNPTTGSLSEPTAWPTVRGFRPGNLDACVNYCEEGFVTHPEWRNDPRFRWRPEGNVLLRVLRIIQSEMDDYYSGRHK
jgi:hypothetical protein